MRARPAERILTDHLEAAFVRRFGVATFSVWLGKDGLVEHSARELSDALGRALAPILNLRGVRSAVADFGRGKRATGDAEQDTAVIIALQLRDAFIHEFRTTKLELATADGELLLSAGDIASLLATSLAPAFEHPGARAQIRALHCSGFFGATTEHHDDTY